MGKIMSLEEAVKTHIRDGVSIAMGGFTGFNRNPVAFAWEIVRQGYKDLHYIVGHPSCATFLMHAGGNLGIHENSFCGYGEVFSKVDLAGAKLLQEEKMIWEDWSHGQQAFRMLAGAVGAPFIAYYAPLGSDILNPEYDAMKKAGLRDGSNPRIPKEKFIIMDDPFYGGGKVVLVPAAKPEVGVIHAQQVGDMGTVRIQGLVSEDKEVAFACDKLIVTCEEVVPEEELRKTPENNLVPFIKVDTIVEVPYGAYPSGVPYYYDYDSDLIKTWDKLQRNEEAMQKWMEEWVYGPKDWNDFLKKVGMEKLVALKANSSTGYSMHIQRGKKPPVEVYTPFTWRRKAEEV